MSESWRQVGQKMHAFKSGPGFLAHKSLCGQATLRNAFVPAGPKAPARAESREAAIAHGACPNCLRAAERADAAAGTRARQWQCTGEGTHLLEWGLADLCVHRWIHIPDRWFWTSRALRVEREELTTVGTAEDAKREALLVAREKLRDLIEAFRKLGIPYDGSTTSAVD